MKHYIGTKLISATPMNRADYNTYRGWALPENENGADEGYLVEYLDGGKPNDDRHAGYISWSPKEQFENAYRETSGMSFGLAIEALKKGHKVARAGWNGKGMWLTLVQAAQWQVSAAIPGMDDDSLRTLPWVGMKTADNKFVPWLASQTDVLADDWQVV
jgi:Protein of unknown function (DUF2829)